MKKRTSAEREPEIRTTQASDNPNPDPARLSETTPSGSWRKEGSSTEAHNQSPQDLKMEEQHQNTGQQLNRGEETTWAVMAHLSVLLNLFTGFLGGIAAIVIYFIYKDRSRFVAYHAMQSFIFQAMTWLGGGLTSGAMIAFGGAFSFLILPLLCLIPAILILMLIPLSLIYGVIGAVQVSNAGDFKYWLIGDWVRNILEPKVK